MRVNWGQNLFTLFIFHEGAPFVIFVDLWNNNHFHIFLQRWQETTIFFYINIVHNNLISTISSIQCNITLLSWLRKSQFSKVPNHRKFWSIENIDYQNFRTLALWKITTCPVNGASKQSVMKHFMSGSFDETVRPDSIVGGSPIWQYAMIVLLSPKKCFRKIPVE